MGRFPGPSKRSRATNARIVQRVFQKGEDGLIRLAVEPEAPLLDRPRCAAPTVAEGSSRNAVLDNPHNTQRTERRRLVLRGNSDAFCATSCRCVIGETANLTLSGLELVSQGGGGTKDTIRLPEVSVLVCMPRARKNVDGAALKHSKSTIK